MGGGRIMKCPRLFILSVELCYILNGGNIKDIKSFGKHLFLKPP